MPEKDPHAAALGRKGGSVVTPEKAAASRENVAKARVARWPKTKVLKFELTATLMERTEDPATGRHSDRMLVKVGAGRDYEGDPGIGDPVKRLQEVARPLVDQLVLAVENWRQNEGWSS